MITNYAYWNTKSQAFDCGLEGVCPSDRISLRMIM